MSDPTREYNPQVETSRLREQVAGLEKLAAHQAKQLLVAAENFGIVKRALEGLIAQGNGNAKTLQVMAETVTQQQAQIEGIAFIQRAGRRPDLLVDRLIGKTPAQASPFELPRAAPDIELP